MSLAELVGAMLLLGLTAYAVLGGADFGAGFWDLTAGRGPRAERIRAQAESSMGPVWEANHVWLIFVLVIFWTGFPVAFGSVMSTLYIPLFLAAVGIIFRGAAFAFRGVAGTMAAKRLLGGTFALSSILTPLFMGAAIGGIASGRVPVGNAVGDPVTSWLNPTSALVGILAVATGSYLAAVYMAGDAARRGRADLVVAFRRRALAAGVVAGGIAMAGLPVLRADARPLFDALTGRGLALIALSAAAGIATLALVWRRAFGPARLTAAAAVAAVLWGWVLSQRPDLLPGELTIEEAAASRPTLVALLVAFAFGALVLVPSLAYLFRLVLRDRLQKELPPLSEPGREGPLP